jgi:hypothetical protein
MRIWEDEAPAGPRTREKSGEYPVSEATGSRQKPRPPKCPCGPKEIGQVHQPEERVGSPGCKSARKTRNMGAAPVQ